MVTVRVLDRDGNVKRRAPGWFGRLFNLRGRLMEYRHQTLLQERGTLLSLTLFCPRRQKRRYQAQTDIFKSAQVGLATALKQTRGAIRRQET